MTAPINIIHINMSRTIQQQRKTKQERWNGYNVQVVYDRKSELDRLGEVSAKQNVERDKRYVKEWLNNDY